MPRSKPARGTTRGRHRKDAEAARPRTSQPGSSTRAPRLTALAAAVSAAALGAGGSHTPPPARPLRPPAPALRWSQGTPSWCPAPAARYPIHPAGTAPPRFPTATPPAPQTARTPRRPVPPRLRHPAPRARRRHPVATPPPGRGPRETTARRPATAGGDPIPAPSDEFNGSSINHDTWYVWAEDGCFASPEGDGQGCGAQADESDGHFGVARLRGRDGTRHDHLVHGRRAGL
jgi:hypothetical protein